MKEKDCNDKISVIIPVYNVDKYIEKCVNSILSSTYEYLEIILVDDGSTDKSYDLCKSFQKTDRRIKVLHQENAGCTNARKNGLKIATGKYVSFVDPDDWIESYMYDELHKIMKRECADMLICPFFRDDDDGAYRTFKSVEFDAGVYTGSALEKIKHRIYANGVRNVNGALWNKLFLKEKVAEIYDGLDKRIYRGEDAVVVVLYLMESNTVVAVDKAYYHAYDRPGSLTRSLDIEYFAQVNYWHNQVYRYLDNSVYRDMIGEMEKFYGHCLLEGILKQTRCELLEYKFENCSIDNKKIIIYGAGKVGKSYYRQFSKMQNVSVISWMDIAADSLRDSRIEKPDRLHMYQFDSIIVAIEDCILAQDICKKLNVEYGVSRDKIIWNKPLCFDNLFLNWLY